jgi:transposase
MRMRRRSAATAEGLSDRAIARSTRLARSTVSDYAGQAVAAGLSWPLPEGLTDTALEALLFVRGGPAAGAQRKPEPDWASLHREPRRPGVTLMLLWQEYRAGDVARRRHGMAAVVTRRRAARGRRER